MNWQGPIYGGRIQVEVFLRRQICNQDYIVAVDVLSVHMYTTFQSRLVSHWLLRFNSILCTIREERDSSGSLLTHPYPTFSTTPWIIS